MPTDRETRRGIAYMKNRTGYPEPVIRKAIENGDLRAEWPHGRGPGRRVYSTDTWLDAWLQTIDNNEEI